MINDTVDFIVTSDTNQLIDSANSIILQCNFPGCTTSPITHTKINQSLSTLSQLQAQTTLNSFAIPTSSITGRNIFNAYLDLGAAVSSTYIYQCGSIPNKSTTCVNNASNVKTSQQTLKSLLIEPVTNESNYLVGLSVLASVAVITLMLFLIFMILGLAESMNSVDVIPQNKSSKNRRPSKIIPVSNIASSEPDIPTPNLPSETEELVPIPVSPFQSD